MTIDLRNSSALSENTWRQVVHEHPLEPFGDDDRLQDSWAHALGCEECGLRVLTLLLESPHWVHRRVEAVDFRDHRTIWRRVSIDFSVPPTAPRLHSGGHAYRLVPLAIMRRKTLICFDLRDEAGLSVPLLGLRQNQAVTKNLLLGLARAVLHPSEPDGHVEALVEDIATGSQDELIAAHHRATKPHRRRT